MKSFSFWAKVAIFAPTGSNKTPSDFTPHVTSKRNKLLNPGFQGFFRCTFPLEIKLNKVKVNSKELIEHRLISFPITNADNKELKTAAKVPRRAYYIAQSIHSTRTFNFFFNLDA